MPPFLGWAVYCYACAETRPRVRGFPALNLNGACWHGPSVAMTAAGFHDRGGASGWGEGGGPSKRATGGAALGAGRAGEGVLARGRAASARCLLHFALQRGLHAAERKRRASAALFVLSTPGQVGNDERRRGRPPGKCYHSNAKAGVGEREKSLFLPPDQALLPFLAGAPCPFCASSPLTLPAKWATHSPPPAQWRKGRLEPRAPGRPRAALSPRGRAFRVVGGEEEE